MFLGKIFVTYLNPGLKDTFGKDSAKPVEYVISDVDGNSQTFEREALNGEIAARIRQRKVSRIYVTLG